MTKKQVPSREPDKVWEKIPNKKTPDHKPGHPYKHGWAFFYFLKNQNDVKVQAIKHNDKDKSITIRVWELDNE